MTTAISQQPEPKPATSVTAPRGGPAYPQSERRPLQVYLYDPLLARLPGASRLTLAAISGNLLSAAGALAGALAGRTYAKARGATVGRDLIGVAARTARHGRGHLTIHLPEGWHREHEWMNLFHATCGPPAAPRPPRPDQRRPGHRISAARHGHQP